ncbi:ADP-ribosylglycohydrolase family protein [Gordonia sp. TBRC 11910]|uniref:ADP-ribosylglycohydrolase family protein n=1 Tax=Gordonia asplenii TaxID=2725283 RepID=A0A848KQL0_9ACTN|nr:ADP-ribosylglycohydrolase family protein [Gordonia asplenii]NMO00339.1 ADP-ribosylglycohydrolase family protein [Gordonia asplenii]
MSFTDAQLDRAVGALIGTAVGDALGIPYEFESRPRLLPGEHAQMLGGGLGDFAPGQWSDDTSMAVAIALAGADSSLTSTEGVEAAASNFLKWYEGGPPDIGIQTRAVLSSTKSTRADGGADLAEAMTTSALAYAADNPRSAGNGALMRTAPVGLSNLNDREATATAAYDIARLTHADPLAVDSCVLWSEAIRIAILDGRIDVRAGLDLVAQERRADWAARLDAASTSDPNAFNPNGFTVTALQAAAAAISQTPVPADDPSRHFHDTLHVAIRIGNDTDTVAAIAGGLLGARWGASAIPAHWRDMVHGWPVTAGQPATAETLASLAIRTLRRQS